MMNDHPAFKNDLFAPSPSEAWQAATHVMSWSHLGRTVEEAWGPGPHALSGSWHALMFKAHHIRADTLLSVALALLGPWRAQALVDPAQADDRPFPPFGPLNLAQASDVFRAEDWQVVTEVVSMMTWPANGVALAVRTA